MSGNRASGYFTKLEEQERGETWKSCEAASAEDTKYSARLLAAGVAQQRAETENSVCQAIDASEDTLCVANNNNDCRAEYTLEQKLNQKETERMNDCLDHWRALEAMAGRLRAVMQSFESEEARKEFLSTIGEGKYRVLLDAMQSLVQLDYTLKYSYVDQSAGMYRNVDGTWLCYQKARTTCEKPVCLTARDHLVKLKEAERQKLQQEMEVFFGSRVYEDYVDVSDRIVEFARLKGLAVRRPPRPKDTESQLREEELRLESCCQVEVKNLDGGRAGRFKDLEGKTDFQILVDLNDAPSRTSAVGSISLLGRTVFQEGKLKIGYYLDGNYEKYPVPEEDWGYEAGRFVIPKK